MLDSPLSFIPVKELIESALGGPRSGDIRLTAVGPHGKVAWVESQHDIATLLVAGGGRLILERPLARTDTRDYGYEGCDALYLAWHGERVVVVSRERSACYLRSLDPHADDDAGISFTSSWLIVGDQVIWATDDPGLLLTAALPSLNALLPLPIRDTPPPASIRLHLTGDRQLEVSSSSDRGGTKETRALPTAHRLASDTPPPSLLELLEQRLFPSGEALTTEARLVLEALAHPFVRAPIWRQPWSPVPFWMPCYWYRHLTATGRKREAHDLLNVLDAIAAVSPNEEPAYSQLELALSYARRQARTLGTVCRTGTLPPGWWCLLFDPAPRSNLPGSRVDPSSYSPVLRRVFEELVHARPGRLRES